MAVTHINNIQDQILHSLKTLSPEKQEQVLEFIQSLQRNSLFEKWDNITDGEAEALQNEFSEEDINLSESVLSDYLSHLEQDVFLLALQDVMEANQKRTQTSTELANIKTILKGLGYRLAIELEKI